MSIINPEKNHFTIGIRADMDALLIEEKTDLEFKSKIKGQMHACGHDAHTAMLLGTAKALKQMEDKISCRVMLVFQPSEEGIRSGAEELVKGGLMDEIDVIIGMHIENWLDSGKIGVCAENCSTAYIPANIQPRAAANGSKYATHGIKLVNSSYDSIKLLKKNLLVLS